MKHLRVLAREAPDSLRVIGIRENVDDGSLDSVLPDEIESVEDYQRRYHAYEQAVGAEEYVQELFVF